VYAQYRYNGLGFRIGWRYDTSGNGYVDTNDPWYWFCHDDAWRIVATFRATDTYPKEVFVHHNAGFGGYGGSSYIDSVILRDKEVKAKWSEEATEERGERRYYCQNWRADVSALLTDAGSMVEWAKYSSYGVPFALPTGDTDSDGDWDATDSAAITGTYDVRKDANLDGVINASDVTHANSITGGYQTLGRGRLSSSGVDNRKGYAGYEYDPTLEAAGKHLYHVRHRVYDADVGRWMRRDPIGYVDGMSLYAYVQSDPLAFLDPMGVSAQSCLDCNHVSIVVLTAPPTTIPVRPSPVTPGPLWTPDPRPIRVPGYLPRTPGILIPANQCIIVGCVAYCIGESLSPFLFPPIDPTPPPPPKPPKPPKDPDDPCEKAKQEKSIACGERTPGVIPPWHKDGLPRYIPGNPSLYCQALRERIQHAEDCLRARQKVTDECFGGVPEPGHTRHEQMIRRDHMRPMEKLFESRCKHLVLN
jgi:RHS repeat-associated protein